MSALSAIEPPVAAADDRGAARSDVSGPDRHLRVVRRSARAAGAALADGSIAAGQPRSSSIRPAADHRCRSLTGPIPAGAIPAGAIPAGAIPAGPIPAGPIPAGPIPAGPIPADKVLTGSVLTGTVVTSNGRRFVSGAISPVSSAPIRLTRRGRIVVTVLLVALLSVAVLLVTALVSGRAQATNHGAARAGYQGMHQVVVRPGQTLWSIAAAADPTADPRNVVGEIMSANALGSPDISVGQLLWVP